MAGIEFERQAHQLHPAAKPVLLFRDGDVPGGMAGLRAMVLGERVAMWPLVLRALFPY
jgi:hypothetical protein